MKRTCVLAGILAIVVVFCLGQSVQALDWFGFGKTEKGSGNLASEERDLPSFDRIELSSSADLIIKVGKDQRVTVSTDDNLLDNIVTEVSRRSTLRIESEGSYNSRRGVTIEIFIPSLKRLVISGSGDVEISGLNENHFDIDINGSGDVDVEGEAREVEISVNGSGDIDCRHLIAKEVEVTIAGSGDVRVYATEYFDGAIYGSGDIDYYGNPENVSRHVHGSGDISRRR